LDPDPEIQNIADLTEHRILERTTFVDFKSIVDWLDRKKIQTKRFGKKRETKVKNNRSEKRTNE